MPRPTRRAAGLLLGGLLLFAVGTSVQAGWVLVLASIVLGTAVAGSLLPARAVRGIDVERHAPAEAFQGEEVEVELAVSAGRRGIGSGLELTDHFLSASRVEVPIVRAGGGVVVSTIRRAARRGVHRMGRVSVSSAAPFGVAEARRTLSIPSSTIVYPAVVPLDAVALIRDVPTFEHSIHAAPRRGGGPEYLGIREYRVGDSMRHVHWPSTAHHGQVMVREFEREHTRRMAVVIDTAGEGAGTPTPLDVACSVAASLAFAAIGRGHGVRLVAAREGELDVLSRAAPSAMLRWLAELRPFAGLSGAEALERVPEHVRGIDTLVLAAPTWRLNANLATAVERIAVSEAHVAAVLIEAHTFGDDGRSPGLGGADVSALALDLVRAGADVYRVPAEGDLVACLMRPSVDV